MDCHAERSPADAQRLDHAQREQVTVERHQQIEHRRLLDVTACPHVLGRFEEQRDGRTHIVFSEIPYQLTKETLLKKLAELVHGDVELRVA